LQGRPRRSHAHRAPVSPIWNPSGCALRRTSAVFDRPTGSITASAPLPQPRARVCARHPRAHYRHRHRVRCGQWASDPSPRRTRTEPSPALATNMLPVNGTCATPCGSLKPVILRRTLPADRSTTPRPLLPSSATSSRRRFASMPTAHLTERDLRLERQRSTGRLRQQGRGPHQACR
jgi:hypothetical protein